MYIPGQLEIRIGVRVKTKKMVEIGVKVLLSWVKTPSASLFLLSKIRLQQIYNMAICSKINYKASIFF